MSNIIFDYCNAKGVASTHELERFTDDGWLLSGYCLRAAGPRTFRRDRISAFHEGGDQLIDALTIAPQYERPPRGERTPSDAIEVLFTGFSKVRRTELESLAKEGGVLVRKSVTVDLSFVCAGPNAGPSKIRRAQAQGVAVLDESDFLNMLATGAIPE